MSDSTALLRLMSWLSPAFPTGAFAYSHGLESAIRSNLVEDKDSLIEWLSFLLENGPGWNDAVILSESWRVSNSMKDTDQILEIIDLAKAMSFSNERHLETVAQGNAFLTAAAEWNTFAFFNEATGNSSAIDCPLPIAVGIHAGALKIDLLDTNTAYLHAYISNQIQAALRLMKLGQQNAVAVTRALEETIMKTANKAKSSTLEDLGTSSIMADISAIQHETLAGRMFRS